MTRSLHIAASIVYIQIYTLIITNLIYVINPRKRKKNALKIVEDNDCHMRFNEVLELQSGLKQVI